MPRIKDLQAPLAIAMWDYSWLLRHYRGGEFEDWDRILDELAERGYNAVRIDAFPHLIAEVPAGNKIDQFRCLSDRFGYAFWGNPWTVDIQPRQGLVEFITKCQERSIYVGLSTWFTKSEPNRSEEVEGPDELIRVWDETLTLLAENDCLQNVIYVDVLNEYPHWHGFKWLPNQLEGKSEPKDPDSQYNANQKDFYRKMLNEVLAKLKVGWPNLDFFASQTQNYWEEDREMDYSCFDLLDIHLWMVLNHDFTVDTGYFEHIHESRCDHKWIEVNDKMMDKWNSHKMQYEEWMDRKIKGMCEVANKWNLPLGNTEGWGAIMWADHPALRWDFIKEAAEIGVRLGSKYGYRFNCTSNFCHPHFPGMWADVEWHKQMTTLIKKVEIEGVYK